MARDYYEVLGVARTADAAELKRAYRELAVRYHPDRNPEVKEAEDRFKEVSEAYEVLSDPIERARYDRTGDGRSGGSGTVGNFTDLFESLFGDLVGRMRGRARTPGRDLRYTVEIDFVEAALGCQRPITIRGRRDCDVCQGTGAQGGEAGLGPCGSCGGKGESRLQQGFFSVAKSCAACEGLGRVVLQRCPACQGIGRVESVRDFTVTIPPGTDDGQVRRVQGEGEPGRRGGAPGDLHVLVRVKSHPIFRRESGVIVCDVPIAFPQAALGASVEVPTLDGKVEMRIPAGTQTGTIFRLRQRGIPGADGTPRGDAHVRVIVETPTDLSPKQRQLLEAFAASCGEESTPGRRGFFAKVKELLG